MSDDLHHTFLTRFCSRGRLEANLADMNYANDPPLLAQLSRLFASDAPEHPRTPPTIDSAEQAEFLRTASQLSEQDYSRILSHMRGLGIECCSWLDFDSSPQTPALPPRARLLPDITLDGRKYSCHHCHYGNSSIQFDLTHLHGVPRLGGFIEHIWEIPVDGLLRTFISVRIHSELTEQEQACTPFAQYPRLLSQLVPAAPSTTCIIIEPAQIVSHVVAYPRPAGSFGIDRDTLALCSALDRGRHPLK